MGPAPVFFWGGKKVSLSAFFDLPPAKTPLTGNGMARALLHSVYFFFEKGRIVAPGKLFPKKTEFGAIAPNAGLMMGG